MHWALLVTQGLVVAYPPEVYRDRRLAEREAERWAWLLGGGGIAPVERPFDGRWAIEEFDVRLIELDARQDVEETWIGTFWTHHGFPDPEALLLKSRAEASAWVQQAIATRRPIAVQETDWFIGATFGEGDREEYAVAHLAKNIELPARSGIARV